MRNDFFFVYDNDQECTSDPACNTAQLRFAHSSLITAQMGSATQDSYY